MMKKFEEVGSLEDQQSNGRPQTFLEVVDEVERDAGNINIVCQW